MQFLAVAHPQERLFSRINARKLARIQPAWLLSESPEQLANVKAVVREGHITGTALLAHPLTKCRQQSWIVTGCLSRTQGDDPGISQVGQEHARTMDHSRRVRMAVMWASASTQVAVESRKRLLVHLTHGMPCRSGPIDEVFRRSEVSASGTGGVARLR